MKFSTKFFMYDVETFGKVSSSRYSGVFSEFGLKSGMVGVIGKEWRFFGGVVFRVVEDKFSKREIVDPVILLIRKVGSNVSLKCLIGTLCETISVRMI